MKEKVFKSLMEVLQAYEKKQDPTFALRSLHSRQNHFQVLGWKDKRPFASCASLIKAFRGRR